MALTALAFVQSPGLIVSDTKYDLVAKPALFLEKALHLWDPIGDFGQVQNQAYGYLFPMGPFFLLGHLASLPEWVIQRSWWALILVVAFLGIVKLCGLLRIGSDWARIVAGLVFALSPRMLTNLGPISIEIWPYALAPWVLIPLVIGSQRGSPRQAAARSGLAAACVGGVNAVASAAILPISAIWLLTRTRGKRRAAMMRWWPFFVGMATLWWLVPLLVLGKYSPPFLDYIESSQGTTATATVADALRGTTKWVPYVANNYVAGSSLISDPLVIIQTGLLVILGLLGLARRDLVERQFLVLCLLVGLFLVTMGHLGAVAGFFSSTLNDHLDHALAPLRNTHKWDVVIRLPLVLGLAHLLTVVGTKVAAGRREIQKNQFAFRAGVLALAIAGAVGGASVALSTSLASSGTFEETPGYWLEATDWLESHAQDSGTYVAPGSEFGDYLWGTPMDEAIQALSSTPWATRTVIPLVPGGSIRMMDVIEDRMVSGRGSAGLRDYLSRAGIRYVLVRNDLRERETVPPAARVTAALESSPGITVVATFGPLIGSGASVDFATGVRVFGADGLSTRRPAIEIYSVKPNPREREATAYASDDLPRFIGDSARLLSALDTKVLSNQPVEFAGTADTESAPSHVILTDGSRRQEVAFGQVHENRSSTRSVEEGYEFSRAAHDYDVGTTERWMTVPVVRGVDSIEASSSAADATFPGPIEPSMHPYAALDSDPDTSWVSGLSVDGRHELRINFTSPTQVEEIQLSIPAWRGAVPRMVEVTTDLGSIQTEVIPGDSKSIPVRSGLTTSLVIAARSDLSQPLRINELSIPGLKMSRSLVLPATDPQWGNTDAIVLAEGEGARSGCVSVDGFQRCVEGSERLSEDGRAIDRVLSLSRSAEYGQRIEVEAWGEAALTSAVQFGRESTISATSQATHQAQSGAFAAFDGNLKTGWVAASSDRDPTLTVAWTSEQRVKGIRVTTSSSLVATPPTHAIVDFTNGQTRTVDLRDGMATFKPVSATGARVRLFTDREAKVVGLDQSARTLAIGVSELTFDGVDAAEALSSEVVTFPCGTGPRVSIGTTKLRTAVQSSPADLFAGGRVQAVLCAGAAASNGSVSLPAGLTRLRLGRGEFVRPVSMVLVGLDPIPQAEPSTVVMRSSDAAHQTASLSEPAELLLLRSNVNGGWRALEGDRKLKPVTIDGWQQGWRLATGGSLVQLNFAPDTPYRFGLAAGLLGILMVVAAALIPRWGARDKDLAPLGPIQIGWTAGTLAVGVTAGLLGGWAGLVVWLLGWTLGHLGWSRRVPRVTAEWTNVAVAASLGFVYLAYAVRPWGGESEWMGRAGWPQLMALFAVSVALAAVFPRRASRRLSRVKGLSTP